MKADASYCLVFDAARAVLPAILTALAWAQRWYVTPEGPAVELTDTSCATAFVAILCCNRCNAARRENQVNQDWHSPSSSANLGVAQ